MGKLKTNSPFLKQCFVTSGVCINTSNMGLVLGFSTVLLPQLRQFDSPIQIDNSSGSWIASLPAVTIIIGNFITPAIMGNFGRKIANIISICITIIGWLCLVLSNNVTTLLAARFINGISMGIILAVGSVLIGEYTSPKNRGVFLAFISISIGVGVLFIQTVGSYVSWRIASIICIGIAIFNLIIVIFSPESPAFLACKGKYDESRKVFKWLRGDEEKEELEKMISAIAEAKDSNEKTKTAHTMSEKIKNKMNYYKATIQKREFYKPILIMIHLFIMAQWSGVNILTSYTADYFEHVVGSGLDINLMIITLQIHRLIASIIGLVLIKRIKRRHILSVVVVLNLAINLAIAGYSFAKANDYLGFDHPAIGITLIHIQVFVVVTGAMPLSYIIAGEVYPMEYKSLCGGIGTICLSLNTFANLKTVPVIFATIGVHGSLLLHSAIIFYCMLVVGFTLPETKDRTLQDIEDEFRGRKKLET